MPSSLEISIVQSPDGPIYSFSGQVDEHSQFESIPLGEGILTFDLAGVEVVNSLGIRGWINWMNKLKDRSFVFRRCSKPVVDQINVLEGFLPRNSVIESFFVPYHCESCDNMSQVLFRHGEEFERSTADRPEQIRVPRNVPCPQCKSPMDMDVIEAKYFRFLRYRRTQKP